MLVTSVKSAIIFIGSVVPLILFADTFPVPGLKITSYFEFESVRRSRNVIGSNGSSITENSIPGIKSDIEVSLFKNVDLIFDLDIEKDNDWDAEFDEAFIEFALEDFTLSFGRMDLPFAETFTQFEINDPLLEFGEVRKSALRLTYEWGAGATASMFGFNSRIDSQPNSRQLDWGLNLHYENIAKDAVIGVAFLSDLTETREPLINLELGDIHPRVSGINAYSYKRFGPWFFLGEVVAALSEYNLASDRDKPLAWSIEMGYHYGENWLVSLRHETTRELDEQPGQVLGLSISYFTPSDIRVSIEYARGKFEDNFAFDNEGNPFTTESVLSFNISKRFRYQNR